MGSSINETPKRHILGRKHVVWRIDRQNRTTCASSARAKEKSKKGITKKPQHVFFHVFAQTTHVVAAPHGFACVVIPATRLYIPSFIEIRSGVSEPREGKGQNLAFPITLASRFYNSLYYRTSRDADDIVLIAPAWKGLQKLISLLHVHFTRPALVAEWLTHSADLCSKAWRAQWPGFDWARARPPTKELWKQKLASVFLHCKSRRSKTANIKILSANSTHRR